MKTKLERHRANTQKAANHIHNIVIRASLQGGFSKKELEYALHAMEHSSTRAALEEVSQSLRQYMGEEVLIDDLLENIEALDIGVARIGDGG